MVKTVSYESVFGFKTLFCGRGNVEKVIDGKDQRGAKQELLENLDLVQVLDRDVENLSGISHATCPKQISG